MKRGHKSNPDAFALINPFMDGWYARLSEVDRGVWLAHWRMRDFRTDVYDRGAQAVADMIGHKNPKHVYESRERLCAFGLLAYEDAGKGERTLVTVLCPLPPQRGIPSNGVYPAGANGCHPLRGEGSTPQRDPISIRNQSKTETSTRGGSAAVVGGLRAEMEMELKLCGANRRIDFDRFAKPYTRAEIRFGFRAAEGDEDVESPIGVVLKWAREGTLDAKARGVFERVPANKRGLAILPYVKIGDVAAIGGRVMRTEGVSQGSAGLLLGTVTIPAAELTLANVIVSDQPAKPMREKTNAA